MNTQKSRLAQFLVANAKTPITTSTLNTVAGSAEGTRRIRELRAEGWPINVTREGRSFYYTLTRVPAKKVIAQYA